MTDKKLGDFEVDVSPAMEIYTLLQSLPYTIESALSEFIDNSLQSFMDNRSHIEECCGEEANLTVTVNIDSTENNITIEDNANGISQDQFQKAMHLGLKPSESHSDSSLSAHGVGMKSSAIWLSHEWTIETSSLGKDERLTTAFDLRGLLRDGRSTITVDRENEEKNKHYTKISILNTLRRETEDYYRDIVLPRLQETFIKFPMLKINIIYDQVKLNTDKIYLQNPTPLHYPKVNKDAEPIDDNSITWRKDIKLQWGNHWVEGYVMLMETGSYKQPGLRLLRNDRVIRGTENEPNKPSAILNTSNKFAAQRIYGELNLNTVPTNFLKTDFNGNLDSLYRLIKADLKEHPDLIQQADYYRSRKNTKKPPSGSPKSKRKSTPVSPSTDKIIPSTALSSKLDELKNSKITRLYKSLCEISLAQHPILAYVGMWVFLEVLSLMLGKENVRHKPFDDFYNKKMQNLYKSKNDRTRYQSAIKEIHEKGNAYKHDRQAHVINAQQLHVDMETLEPFLIDCINSHLS